MLAFCAFTGLYWGFVWRKWKDLKGCNNQVRVAFVWVVEIFRLWAFVIGSVVASESEPNTIKVRGGVYKRRYRVVNKIPDAHCNRVAIFCFRGDWTVGPDKSQCRRCHLLVDLD
jgi:hypothetical protein